MASTQDAPSLLIASPAPLHGGGCMSGVRELPAGASALLSRTPLRGSRCGAVTSAFHSAHCFRLEQMVPLPPFPAIGSPACRTAAERATGAVQEAQAVFLQLMAKLDALSHLSVAPKANLAELEVRVDAAAIAMEDAAPVIASAASTRAPEELHAQVCACALSLASCLVMQEILALDGTNEQLVGNAEEGACSSPRTSWAHGKCCCSSCTGCHDPPQHRSAAA